MDKYSYKAVLVVPAAAWFRGNDLSSVLTRLTEYNLTDKQPRWAKIKSQDDLDYCFALYKTLYSMQDYTLRVESPFVSIYTNTPKNIDKLTKLDASRVKYVSVPPTNGQLLEAGAVIMVREGYNFKVTLGRTTRSHTDFIDWAETTGLVKLTGSAKKGLARNTSWGGGHFYVKDDRTLTMVKMFLGGGISRVDRVVKAVKP